MCREINCHLCGTYLGEIRDAKLKTGMVHYCKDCNPYPQEVLEEMDKALHAIIELQVLLMCSKFYD